MTKSTNSVGKSQLSIDTTKLGIVKATSMTSESLAINNNALINISEINVLNVVSTGGLKFRNNDTNTPLVTLSSSGLLYVFNDTIVNGNFAVNGTHNINMNWIAADISISGVVYVNKGISGITSAAKLSGDMAYTITFPAHPEGTRYIVQISSGEFHTLYRAKTSTSLVVYLRSSTNSSTSEGNLGFGLVILKQIINIILIKLLY